MAALPLRSSWLFVTFERKNKIIDFQTLCQTYHSKMNKKLPGMTGMRCRAIYTQPDLLDSAATEVQIMIHYKHAKAAHLYEKIIDYLKKWNQWR